MVGLSIIYDILFHRSILTLGRLPSDPSLGRNYGSVKDLFLDLSWVSWPYKEERLTLTNDALGLLNSLGLMDS